MAEQSSKLGKWIGRVINIYLAILIALFSVTAAFVAFQEGELDGQARENFFRAQLTVTDANSVYLEANQAVQFDYENFDRHIVNSGVDDFAAEYYFSLLSVPAQESMERDTGPFDQIYQDTLYGPAYDLFDDADQSFQFALTQSEASGNFGTVGLILAVGIVFTAWASLARENLFLSAVFTALASLIRVPLAPTFGARGAVAA